MSRNSEYWFIHYDREFADKDFMSISFKKYETLVTSLPQFKALSGEYPQSNHILESEMQLRVANILDIMMKFFSPDNVAIHSFEKTWIDFVQRVQHYINCEKIYALMFWRFNFNNQFVVKRVIGFYIRFTKFLEAFHYSLYKGTDERLKKSRRIESIPADGLHAKITPLSEFIGKIWQEISSIQAINKQCNPQSMHEDSLFMKLKLLTSLFLSKSITEIHHELRGFSDSRLVVEILHANDVAIKGLDNYLAKFEKEAFVAFEGDKKLFETSIYKDITTTYDVKFKPVGESEATEESFWERMEIYRMKHKKRTTQSTGLTTNNNTTRDYSTQASSMNTEQTDEYIPDNFDEFNQSSITKSLRSEKFEQKFDESRKQSFLDSESFSKSPNNPYNTGNPMLQFLLPEVQDYQKQMQNQAKQQKLMLAQAESSKMKYGNENMKDIVKALKNNKKKRQLNQHMKQMQQQATGAGTNSQHHHDDENSEDEENGEDMEYEDEEDDENYVQEDTNQKETLDNRNKELDISNVMDFVRKADARLVAIKDSDIDFDQSKTTRLNIKRRDDVNNTTRMTNASTAETNANKSNSFIGGMPTDQSRNSAQANRKSDEYDLLEDGDEEIDPSETPQPFHLGEQGLDHKDDDIFDYSFEKDDDDDDDDEDSDDNGSYDSDNDDDDGESQSRSRKRESASEKVKLRVPYTQFKSQIENSFIRFLKESVYSQDTEQSLQPGGNMSSGGASSGQGMQSAVNGTKKRTPKVSLKVIFQDNRVVYLNGNSFVHYFRENFWMVLNNFVKKNKVFKVTETYLKQPLMARQVPMLQRKRLNACEQMQINN